MKFTDIFIRRPVLAISLSLLIIVLGLQAISKLTVREYPKMTTTVVTVSTTYAGADASLIQAFVTSKLEEAVAQAENIDFMSSSSSPSTSTITVKMKLNTDPNAALADILAKVNSVRSELPSGIDDPSVTSSTGGSGMMYLSFTSDKLSGPQVTDYLERVVKPQLFTVNGIAKITTYGASSFALRIWLDPEKMAAQGISATTVNAALAANNVQTAAGNDNGYYVFYKNKVDTTTKSVDELGNLVVSNNGAKLVRLRDIADIELNKEDDDTRTTANGGEAVVLAIEQSSNANPLTVAEDVYPVFKQIQAALPDSMHANILYDRTVAINSSIESVLHTIVEAVVIVLVVITLFLGSLRAIFIPVVTIPISLIGVLFMLQILGFSINLMTLLALILAIGLVVDDAIVVVENVDRHIKLGETPFRAAIIGTREIAVPVISMTIALVAVYSPMALMDGITGSLFKEFALTLAGSVFISGIVALTLSPMMTSKMLKHGGSSKFEVRVNHTLGKITEIYTKILRVFLNARISVLAFALGIFITLPILFSSLSSELTPTEDKGAFIGIATAPSNINVDYIQDSMKQYEAIVNAMPEKEYMQVISGVPNGNNALVITTLKDWKERNRSQNDIMADLNTKAAGITEVTMSNFAFPEIDTGEQGPPISFVIQSAANYKDIANVAAKVLSAAQASGKFVYLNLDLKFDTAQMHITIDREKANTYGISMANISTMLGYYLSGANIQRVDIDGRAYKTIAQVKRKDRLSPESFNGFYLTASDGTSVPLASLIHMTLEPQPRALAKFSQMNSATIQAVMVPGNSVGDGIAWFQNEGTKFLPQGYNYDWRGEARQLVQEGSSLATTFALAVVIIFLVLAIQFESWRDPMVIIVSVPLAISGALLVLNLLGFFGKSGATLNIYSEVGLITLVGLITKHGILMCEVAKEAQLLHGKNRVDAITEAARTRLRPILMTTAAMIAGLVPLLYATGAGAVMRFSMGVTIVAGLAVGTLFTLFILPVIYTFIASEHEPLPEFDESIPAIEGDPEAQYHQDDKQ
ncbi:efflux RND transporter permease subunit [Pasteurellaceae bacterium LIM206]|nr:efflux RND transporter permease subunit [Pasteurellaceae bacterium LIM206]